jgi:murein DD-endopeptidase MepM/ murein hydrolase activator NlpD
MTYTVRAGDTLSKIAMRNGVTLAQLLQANPQVKDPNKIRAGDVLNVPNEATTENTRPLPGNMAPKPMPAPTPVETSSPAPAIGAIGKAIAEELGKLSAKYETGGRGPGTVSSGAGDPGGVSYGSYQMASKMGVPTRFVTQSGFRWLQDFQNLTAGTPQFTAVWKRIAAEQPDAFQEAQHAYIKKTHYDLLVAKILGDDKLDVNTRSGALQNVVWSTAVQHGPGTPIVHRACCNVSCATTDPRYDELLIRAIYAERGRKKPDGKLAYFSRSSPNVQASVSNRFKNELQDALAMLAREV